MVDENTVWEAIWPIVECLIQAALVEDGQTIGNLLVPGEQAAEVLDLFGPSIFNILLKTVLKRDSLGVTQVIETEDGRSLYLEYAWLDPQSEEGRYTAADAVSVRLQPYKRTWQVAEINPTSANLLLNSSRARNILASLFASNITAKEIEETAAPWVLPVAVYSGLMQVPLRSKALRDPVEKRLLPGLQQRSYGLMSLIRARRLWRDFKKAAAPSTAQPHAWAAAVEYIMGKQEMRDVTQAGTGKHYQASLSAVASRAKRIEKALNIQKVDERYTDLQTTEIIYKD